MQIHVDEECSGLNYTAVYDKKERSGLYEALAFNSAGMFEHVSASQGRHLGKLVAFETLPEHLKNLIVWGER